MKTKDFFKMALQHKIWELVSMITQNAKHVTPDVDETVLSRPVTDDTVAGTAKQEQEAEISRLTWAVLGGQATMEQRQRLAELVSQQHQQRTS